MAITEFNLGGAPEMTGLNGVYRGQQQPELLGLKSLSLNLENFWIGFDTRIRPSMVRIYFDPFTEGLHQTDNYDFIGLIQIGRITYQKIPINPAIFGMGLNHLNHYNYTNANDPFNENIWVDMMDVVEMRKMKLANNGTLFPFFPYNGYLRNNAYTPNQFFTHPMPNGSLTSIPAQEGAGVSLCASLFDAIDFDLDVPPATEITKMLRRMITNRITPIKEAIFNHTEVLRNGPLSLALTLLEIEDLELIDDIQVAGPHLIITLKDIEAESPTFIAFFDQSKETSSTSTMLIFLANSDELEQLRFAALTGLFDRISKYFASKGILGGAGFPNQNRPTLSRGNKGLNPFPFVFNDNQNHEIAFTYDTITIGVRNNKIEFCFGCLKWEVSRVFDRDTLEFGALKIEKPALHNDKSETFNLLLKGVLEHMESHFIFKALTRYDSAISSKVTIATTNPYFYEDTKELIYPNNPAYGDGTQTWNKD